MVGLRSQRNFLAAQETKVWSLTILDYIKFQVAQGALTDELDQTTEYQ